VSKALEEWSHKDYRKEARLTDPYWYKILYVTRHIVPMDNMHGPDCLACKSNKKIEEEILAEKIYEMIVKTGDK